MARITWIVCLSLMVIIPFSSAVSSGYRTCGVITEKDCRCGSNGKTFKTYSKECILFNYKVGFEFPDSCLSCDINKYNEDPCEKFKLCETCNTVEGFCSSCPPGATGRYCDKLDYPVEEENLDKFYLQKIFLGALGLDSNEPEEIVKKPEKNVKNPEKNINEPEKNVNEPEKYQYVNEPEKNVNESYHEKKVVEEVREIEKSDSIEKRSPEVYPIDLVIHPGETVDVTRFKRASTECLFPDHMDTAEIRCAIWPTYTKCNVTCIWGHKFSSGERTATIKCRNRENSWKPHGFKECQSEVNCDIKFKSPGFYNCIHNRINDPIECDIECDEYDDIPATRSKKYSCTEKGRFEPELPFCVEKDDSKM